MKKVAGISLMLTLLLSTAFAQSASRQSINRPRDSFSPESDKRFRKILGDKYQGQVANEAQYDEERKKRRRRQQSANYDGSGPDYARPTNLIEMGIRFAPSLNLNTAQGSGAYTGFLPNGSGIRMSVGPTIDYFFFKDRYALSSGLFYTIKRSGFQMPGNFGESRVGPGAPYKESTYNLQYLQVPVSVKLFANNIAPSMRVYVQTGGLLSLKLAEHALEPERNGLYLADSGGDRRQYGFGDIELLLGAGIQYRINPVNAVNIGLSYQRGLLDVARGGQLLSKSRAVSLDLGFKF
ncbi:MAG: PorT family protein [Spirosoma sp.]|nr:PorT family protein [Spirosoma sp.]